MGSEEQRYNENGYRLVAGCIPYRKEKNSGTVKILMVKSQNGRNFVFPKGGWERREKTAQEAAVREAEEEAGVQGQVRTELGTWTFPKSKQLRNPLGFCVVRMFMLEVTEELDSWPEQHRERMWFDLDEIQETIIQECRHDWMVEALGKFIEQQERGPFAFSAKEVSSAPVQWDERTLQIQKVVTMVTVEINGQRDKSVIEVL